MPRREVETVPSPLGSRVRSGRRSCGSLGSLPPNAIVLAQVGGTAIPSATSNPCGGTEPTSLNIPGFRNLQLRDVQHPLFRRQGPRPDDVVQGAIATCPAAAAMVAMAHADPAAIRSMITAFRPGPPRAFRVRFRRRNARLVCVTTRFYHRGTQIVYAHSRNNVIWPNLLEKAYAVFAGGNSYSGLASSRRQLGSPPTVTQVMQDFVGNFHWSAHTNAQNVTQPLSGLSPAERRRLVRALQRAGRRPTIAGSLGSNVPRATNVVANHSYAILGYRGGRVTLRNPWNDTSQAGGAQFHLRLNQFLSAFQIVLWRQ